LFLLSIFLRGTSGTGTLHRVDTLDILSLLNGTLVGTQAVLGEFVNTLVGCGSTSLDHIQNSAFIGGKANNLTGNFTA
jgi:hypothetical protein